MADKFDFAMSTGILESILAGRTYTSRGFSLDSKLGDMLPTPDDRGWFQQEVRTRVKAYGFRIKIGEIPIDPGFTIGEIADRITYSVLPGNPTVPDDD
jgi:hypothetical protein